ncbi:Mitochondrial 5'-3' exonuclease and sliding exonuclease, partial [Irineochytrium annulatum]
TRAAKSIPRAPETSLLQIAVYRHLYESLNTSAPNIDAGFIFEKLAFLNPDLELTQAVAEHADKTLPPRRGEDAEKPWTLRTITPIALRHFALMPSLDRCELHYRWQEDGSLIGVTRAPPYNPLAVRQDLDRCVAFWEGKLETEGTMTGVEDIEEVGRRCGSCMFKDVCDWRERKQAEFEERMRTEGHQCGVLKVDVVPVLKRATAVVVEDGGDGGAKRIKGVRDNGGR